MAMIVTGLVSKTPEVYTNRAGDVSVTLELEIRTNDHDESVSVVIDDDSLVALVLREVGVGTKVMITARRLAVRTWAEVPRAVVMAYDVKVLHS
jgi:hypothetical protein